MSHLLYREEHDVCEGADEEDPLIHEKHDVYRDAQPPTYTPYASAPPQPSPPDYDDNLDITGRRMVFDEFTICFALVSMCFGFVFWPAFCISLLTISSIKKNLSRYSRQYCKVSSIYYISLVGTIIGVLGSIAIIGVIIMHYNNLQ